MAKRFVQPVWEAIERARKMPSDQLPSVIERELDPPQVPLIVNILSAILNDFCARERLAVGLTATMGDLRELVRTSMSKEPLAESNLLMKDWRREFVLPILTDVLAGKRSLRMTNLQADSPFALE